MINEHNNMTLEILERYPETRTDSGADIFLNIMAEFMFKEKKIDFRHFKVESLARSRRKVLERNPHLDNRTKKTAQAEEIVRAEMRVA